MKNDDSKEETSKPEEARTYLNEYHRKHSEEAIAEIAAQEPKTLEELIASAQPSKRRRPRAKR